MLILLIYFSNVTSVLIWHCSWRELCVNWWCFFTIEKASEARTRSCKIQ